MAFITKQKNNPKFKNYMSAVLALNKAGECLEPFTEKGIQGVFDTIKGMLGHLPQCTKQCSKQIPTVKNWCNTCKQWKQNLETYHKHYKYVKWDHLHSWLWPQDANKIFEVFANVRTIQPNHKDSSTIFCVWNNCREFDDRLATKSHSLRDMRNNLFHNECEISVEALEKILNAIRQLLGEQDIRDTMGNYAEVIQIFDELEKKNIWFDDSLLIRSMKELIDNQHTHNQERIQNIEERVQSLMETNKHICKEMWFRKTKKTVIWLVLPVILILVSYVLFHFYTQSAGSTLTDDSTLGIQRYGCLYERPKNAVLQANFSMEGYLTPYNELLGRTWLFQEVEGQLLRPDTPSHGLVLIAEMGYGKTAFMKHVICAEENTSGALLREHVAAYHVCRFQSKRTRNVGLFILRITSMISINLRNFSKFIDTDKTCTNNYGTIDECEADMFGCFDQCVVFPLRDELHGLHNPLIIVIDAIDECSEETTGTNNILNLLNRRIHNLPRWIQFMISSRNISLIHSLDQILRIHTLSSNDSRNIQDINLYLKYHNVSDTKLNESNWNFQIQKFLLEQSDDTILSTSSSPEVSLYRYYELNFDRLFENNYEIGKYILNIICASDEPLGESTLIDIVSKINVNVREAAIKKTVLNLRHFISIINGKVQLIHNSLKHWLADKDSLYRIDLRKGHQDIAAYFIKHLPSTGYDTADLLIHICKALYPPVLVEGFRNLNTTELQISESYQDLSIYHRLALKTNDGQTVHLAHHHVKSIDFINKHRVPASYTAAMHGNEKVLYALVELGVDINFRVNFPNMINVYDAIEMIESLHWNYGLLDIAAQYGRTRVVKYLLQNDSYQIDTRNGAHLLPIHLACKFGYLEIVSMMHTQFAWMLDHICLYFSATHGFRDIVQYCLDHDIYDDCMPCNTSLYWLSKNQVRMQGNKMSFYVDVVLYDDWHYIYCETALHAAVVRNHSDIVQMLVQRAPFTIGCFDRSGKTPFMHAIIHDYRQIGSFMMESKYFNPSVTCKPFLLYENTSQLSGHELNKLTTHRCPEDTSLMHLSAQFDRTWFIERIFAKMGYHSEKRDEYGCHPLHYAACRGSIHILRHFVKFNSTHITDLSCSNGSLLIHSAAICGSVEGVKLLRKFFSANVVDKVGRTAVMYAVMRHIGRDTAFDAEFALTYTSTIVDELQINEYDLNVHDKYQRNIFHYVIAHGHFSVMTVMMERYPDLARVLLKKKDAFGLNPVSYAITRMIRDNTFRLNVTDLLEFGCREHRQKTLMSPTEYSIFLLFLRHSKGLVKVKLNTRRVLGQFIEKNSFQLFTETFKCIKPNLTRDDDERVLNKLVKHDASGLMMFVYARMRWFNQFKITRVHIKKSGSRHIVTNDVSKTVQNDLSKCATKFEFSITHFLALHIHHMFQSFPVNERLFIQRIYTPIVQMYFESIDANQFNTCYDSDGYNVLERAIQGGNVKFVKFLIKNGFRTARDTCELLLMTVTPYKFRNSSDLLWVRNISKHHEVEILVFNILSNDIYKVFDDTLQWIDIQSLYYAGHFSDKMTCDNMGQYLLEFYHDNLSDKCICSNGSLQLSFVHYLAMQDYKLSMAMAVKYFGKSILMCTNRHSLTPLFFAKLFNSSESINYLESQNIKLQMPELVTEQTLLFTIQTKYYFNKTMYEKCFPFKIGGVYTNLKFRRIMIMIRCLHKLFKLFGLKDEKLTSDLSKLKARSIMVNNYIMLRRSTFNFTISRLSNNDYVDRKMGTATFFIEPFDMFQRDSKFHIIGDSTRQSEELIKFVQLKCSVLRKVFIRKLKLELQYPIWRLLTENLSLEEVCSDIYFILNHFEHKSLYNLNTYRVADRMKLLIMSTQITTNSFPFKYQFYLKRIARIFRYTRISMSNLWSYNYFNNIRYTSSYRYFFISNYTSIDATLKFSHTIGGILSREMFKNSEGTRIIKSRK